MKLKPRIVMFIATGAYTGYIPVAPGTFGSLLGLLFCFLLSGLTFSTALFWVAALTAVAVWSAHEAEQAFNRKDPRCIVIDEITGMAVTMLGIPFHALPVIAGFFIFRILDVLKPFPIGYLDKRVPGGLGIVVDDVAAGIIGNIILRATLYILPTVME